MDFGSLKEQIANISLYDVKAAVRKAQNVVMNYTEMEAKVREATNNEPWGASSTLMQEIANGTYNYQLLNEIMPMIYKRFLEKTAEEWRQIYKALQLLEFLVKNGSEQVIDDARSHVSTIKMLRQFHYIDLNGKDQGVNVRNRAKELGELLNDVDRIRAERKKARAARNKYSGAEGGSSFGGGSGFGGGLGGSFGRGLGGGNRSSRFGGFGSDSMEFGGYGSDAVYGDGGGYGGSSKYNDEHAGSSRFNNRQKFEEYDEYDEGAPSTASKRIDTTTATDTTSTTKISTSSKAVPDQSVDLLSGDDLLASSSNGKDKESSSKRLSDTIGGFAASKADDDDFDDFQAAPAPMAMGTSSNVSALLSAPPPPAGNILGAASSTATTFAAPQPRSSQQAANITGLVGMTTPNIQKSAYAPPPTNNASLLSSTPLSPIPAVATNTAYQPVQPNYFTSISATPSSSILSPQSTESTKPTPATTKSANDAFSSIWASAVASGIKKPTSAGPKPSTPVPGSTMAEMAKSRAQSGLWGTPTPTSNNAFGSLGTGSSNVSKPAQQNLSKGDLDDLLG